MLCNLRNKVTGGGHVIQKIQTNRKASVSSTTANQLHKKLTGEVKSKPDAAGLQVDDNEPSNLSKSAALIKILRLFSRPINLGRNVNRQTSQATGSKLERERDDGLDGDATLVALVALVAAHPDVPVLTPCKSP
jgi:hypothetical protein